MARMLTDFLGENIERNSAGVTHALHFGSEQNRLAGDIRKKETTNLLNLPSARVFGADVGTAEMAETERYDVIVIVPTEDGPTLRRISIESERPKSILDIVNEAIEGIKEGYGSDTGGQNIDDATLPSSEWDVVIINAYRI